MGDLLLSQYVCMKTGYVTSVTQNSAVYAKNYKLTYLLDYNISAKMLLMF